jgi:hypothetical protein
MRKAHKRVEKKQLSRQDECQTMNKEEEEARAIFI